MSARPCILAPQDVVEPAAVMLVVVGAEHRLEAGDPASVDGGVQPSCRNAATRRPDRLSLAVHEPVLAREHA